MTTSKATTSTTTTVATADGRVQGLREHGVASFLGVRFAAPPVGDLRFRPPQPHEPWDGVRDCTRPGPTAPQPVLPDGLMPQTIVEGDGILHLDVHTPALKDSPPTSPSAGAALTALLFRIPGLGLASARAAEGAAPTYVHETTWRPGTPLGAVHGCDVAFAFDAIDHERVAMLAGGLPPRSLADDMAGAVARFASTGAPGWPAYRPDDRREMAFDVPSRVRTDPDPLAHELFSPIR